MSKAKSLETLVKKGLIDDSIGKTGDVLKGAAITVSMPFVAFGGMELAEKITDYANSHNVPVCFPAIPFVALYFVTLAAVMPSFVCYYFTPPSERVEWNKHHFWIPNAIVNYMNRKTAERCAKTA